MTPIWMPRFLWRCTARGALSMPRGSAPIVPRGYALRICFDKYTALAVALMRETFSCMDVSFFVEMHRDAVLSL